MGLFFIERALFFYQIELLIDPLHEAGHDYRHIKIVLGFCMTKSELIARLAAQNPSLYHRDIERLVNTVFDTIIDALEDGDRVELRGFGAFSVRHRESRMGRNPRTGEAVQVEAKSVPFFKMGKGMKERLNK